MPLASGTSETTIECNDMAQIYCLKHLKNIWCRH